ncbi:MAG: valine--tRNA ligase [Chitinophagaceae bacterium]|nr:MAG: valine--tRNA ligase [Chitinophagaceae bacterium]
MSDKKQLDTVSLEKKWYKHWESLKVFESKPDERTPYTIVIPPPNVTGRLHMGHMLNNTIQDVLIRRARLLGYNACWVPGTDHASIATEAKVVHQLREKGLSKSKVGREAFLEHAYEWKENYGNIILEQLKKLGASCDWSRTRFTMDENLSKSVVKVFIDLHNKGLIYKGKRMTNWDPEAKTALSDEEVIYKEEDSKLYFINYIVADEDGNKTNETVTIATTRPETLLGDTAICVHPDDERFKHLHGKTVFVPLVNRRVPVITDTYVEIEFGTGVLKVTPAHDPNDYELGQKHDLKVIDIFDENAVLNEQAVLFVGKNRFEARKEIVIALEENNLLEKVENIQNKIGYSERTQAVIEPRLTEQWFLDMKKLADPALKKVMEDEIRFFPPKFKNTYKHWMENIKDWCISRQLWWGQRIPAYFYNGSEYVVAETKEAALELARKKSGNSSLTAEDLKQDEDVVDTWFSSWLWPISVFDGFDSKNTEEFNYYYPTNVLVTGWDIMFFWVARMIMAGLEFKNQIPFKDVYFHGMVRDKKRRKMSKSLGNSPDPLDLIESFGADGTRVGMMMSAPAGNDLLFDEKRCEQGRNFTNKLWNALKLIKNWEIDEKAESTLEIETAWIEAKLQKVTQEIENSFEQYRLFEALMSLYNFVWDDFCSWYLEMIKPPYGEKIDSKTHQKVIEIYEKITLILHPFMPFITEEIWQQLRERQAEDSICKQKYSAIEKFDSELTEAGEEVKKIITGIREIKIQLKLKKTDKVSCVALCNDFSSIKKFQQTIMKLSGINDFTEGKEEVQGAPSFVSGKNTFYIITEQTLNLDEIKEKLLKEKAHAERFILSIQKKLKNEQFVQNAPAKVIELEKKKLSDSEEKLKAITESLSNM